MKIYAFYISEDWSYNSNISYHFTKKGAYKAMLKEMKSQALEWHDNRIMYGKGRKGSVSNIGFTDWKWWKKFGVREVNVEE